MMIALYAFGARAQQAEPLLDEINRYYSGAVRFSLTDRDELMITIADQRGLLRQDIVPLTEIDIDRIGYSLNDDAIVMHCDSLHARCIISERFRQASSMRSNQALLPRPLNDAGGQDLIASLWALTRTYQERLAETPAVGHRKN